MSGLQSIRHAFLDQWIAVLLLDAVVRLLPGVMGGEDSANEESFSAGLLEYPHYTKPAEWQGRAVPATLLSGNHAAIAAWRRAVSEQDTRERRPDLWERHISPTHLASSSVLPITAGPRN